MTCPACGHENRANAKFCEECAAPLKRTCIHCTAELRPTAKFCDECGTAVAGAASPSPANAGTSARKIVSIVFADLVGSTALHERLDPESVRLFMERYYTAMRSAVEAHGGRVTQLLGDGVKAVFGAPRVAEDDAIRAVRAAVQMQRAFDALAASEGRLVGHTGLRVAVNTGEVVADGASEIIGDPVNVAARLQEKGAEGDVVIGGETQRLVAAFVTLTPLGSFALKGRTEPVKAFRVESLEPPARESTAAFVGREDELTRLRRVYDAACTRPATQLGVLLGSAGLGKSRLIDEFSRRLDESAWVMTAHCDAIGGASFAPVAQALREGLGVKATASGDALRAALEEAVPGDDTDRARIITGVTALLGGSPASPEETFFVVRRLLGALAAVKPVLLVIDDVHWAEPVLLDLVEHLVQWGAGTRLCILVGARPELRDVRSALATPGGLVADVIALAGLDAGAAMRLAASVIGAADLPAALAAKLLATSEGNPLFVGELVRMLVDEGALTREGNRWVTGAGLATLEMPPTIHALLASRIERLSGQDRAVLECAAVVGRHFSRSSVAALLSPREVAELDTRLEALRRSELIERDSGWLLGEPALRFHHVLIRDAAYRRLLKHTRADLHGRLADWMEARAGDAVEHDETIGWHLEQACLHLHELGPLDASGVELGTRAAQRLAAAGRRALERDDTPLAASLLGRAFEVVDRANAMRAQLALDWCEALLSAGDVSQAPAAIQALRSVTAGSQRLSAWRTCFEGQLTALTEPQSLNATATAVAAAAVVLAAEGDAAGEAKAHQVHAQALMRLGRVGDCEAALDRALAAARRAGDQRRANAVLAGAPLAALWGPSPVTRASGRCLDVVRVLRITQGAPAVEAVALSCQGVLEALRGRTDAAQRMLETSRAMVEELGIAHRVFEVDVFAGRVAAMLGNAADAQRLLGNAYRGLRDLGLRIDAARAGALLARALHTLGEAEAAQALTQECRTLAGDDLQAAIAWRGARAEVLAKSGESEAALELAQAAVAMAADTDALLDHADARMALAAALHAAGRHGDANDEEHKAIELWTAKGATLLAGQAARAVAPAPTRSAAQSNESDKGTASVRRRVRANAATRNSARIMAAVSRQDFEAIRTCFSPSYAEVDHPSGAVYDRDAGVDSIRRFLRSRQASYFMEPLATLGESLMLGRRHTTAAATGSTHFDTGPYENDAFEVWATDPQGRFQRGEVFAAGHLSDALVRLYELYAETVWPDNRRAATTARTFALRYEPSDPDRIASSLADVFEAVDHRRIGTWSARSAAGLVDQFRKQLDLAEVLIGRDDDVLALEPDAFLVRRTWYGTSRAGGRAFENVMLELSVFNQDGFTARLEVFELANEAEALARFEALMGSPDHAPESSPLANAASRADDEKMRCFNVRDWAGIEACVAPTLVFDERRRMLRNVSDKDGWLTGLRHLYDVPGSRFETRLVATRGERLSLHVHAFTGDATQGGGPLALEEHLALHEVDGDGLIVAIVLFDLADRDAARAELDARYRSAEGADTGAALVASPQRFANAASASSAPLMARLIAHDWAGFKQLFAQGFRIQDRRRVVQLELDRDQYIAFTREIADGRAARGEVTLLATRGERLALVRCNYEFTDANVGPSDVAFLLVTRVDDHGLVDLYVRFDVEDAHAAYAELDARYAASDSLVDARGGFSIGGFGAAIDRRDWDAVAALCAETFVEFDRKRVATLGTTRGAQDWAQNFRALVELAPDTLYRVDHVRAAARGYYSHGRWLGTRDGGHYELTTHAVLELDEAGRIARADIYDDDGVDAALARLAELDVDGESQRRSTHTAQTGAEHPMARAWVTEFQRAFAARDWEAMVRLQAPDQIAQNHRLTGWGTLRGSGAWISTLTELVALAPDVRFELDHLRTAPRAILWRSRWAGTREGGSFEMPIVVAVALNDAGTQQRIDVFEASQLDDAVAVFDAIRNDSGQPPVNAAARTLDRGLSMWETRDWPQFAALFADNFRGSDRRALMRLELNRDEWLASYRAFVEMTTSRPSRELLATRGDRLALVRVIWEGAEGPIGTSQLEWLLIIEVDTRGDHIAVVTFDTDAMEAAHAELDSRFAADRRPGLIRPQ